MPLWPYFWNLNGDGKRGPGLALGRQVPPGSGWPAYFVERRLGVERIDVRRPAVHEQVDDALGLGREMRRAAATADRWPRRMRVCGADDEIAQRERAEAHAAALQQFAAGEGQVFELELVGHVVSFYSSVCHCSQPTLGRRDNTALLASPRSNRLPASSAGSNRSLMVCCKQWHTVLIHKRELVAHQSTWANSCQRVSGGVSRP